MQPYEEREYRCLGQWKEGDFVYTYTQRTDAAAHECFVGSISSEEEIYIIEAGEHCDRKVNPLDYGMKLVRQGMFIFSIISKSYTQERTLAGNISNYHFGAEVLNSVPREIKPTGITIGCSDQHKIHCVLSFGLRIMHDE